MNCEAGEVSVSPPWAEDYLAQFPDPVNSIYQRIVCSGDAAGAVAVFLYEDEADVQAAYGLFSRGDPVENIGEQASGQGACGIVVEPGGSAGMACWADFAFRRCSAAVMVGLDDITDAEAGYAFVAMYAQQLDEALSPVVCLED